MQMFLYVLVEDMKDIVKLRTETSFSQILVTKAWVVFNSFNISLIKINMIIYYKCIQDISILMILKYFLSVSKKNIHTQRSELIWLWTICMHAIKETPAMPHHYSYTL